MSDNGGAIAQKGFTYQNHVVALVAIRNYLKPNFIIYVEAKDDFEVMYDEKYHACIQVKGVKDLSLTKLLKSSNNKPSIFDKNLSSGTDESTYKIVVYKFSEKDLKDMQEQIDTEELFYNSWILSDEQKNRINNKRINNFALVKTEFNNTTNSARTFLKGELVDQKIMVDGRSDIILNELLQQIQQRSEKEIVSEADRELKKITSSEIALILQKVTAKARFEEELRKFKFTSIKNEKIKREESKIILEYMVAKKAVIQFLKSDKFRLENESLEQLMPDILILPKLNGLSENSKYAVGISAYCDILEGIANGC